MPIRTATAGDLESIVDLHADGDLLTVFGDQRDPDQLERLRLDKATLWTALLAQPPHGQRAVVAVDQGVVGFASSGPDPELLNEPYGRVFALFVARNRWGQGFGTDLLASVETHLRDVAPKGRLWVVADNDRAKRLYERHGWASDGRDKHNAGTRWLSYTKELR